MSRHPSRPRKVELPPVYFPSPDYVLLPFFSGFSFKDELEMIFFAIQDNFNIFFIYTLYTIGKVVIKIYPGYTAAVLQPKFSR